jgi:hypothetical protein
MTLKERLIYFILDTLKIRKNARRFIDPKLGVEGFFKALNNINTKYIVLRWFETLPHLKPAEDIDLLISDECLQDVEALFTGKRSSGIPCDLYTAGGLSGTSYRGMAYYPTHKAEEMLNNATLHQEKHLIPNPKHHFFSLAYHAAYHKGFNSGIPTSNKSLRTYVLTRPDHNYHKVLKSLSFEANISLPENFTLEDLDDILDKYNWKPGTDTLEKLSKYNLWLKETFFSSPPDSNLFPHLKGLATYLIREEGMEHIEGIKGLLWRSGFDIIHTAYIPVKSRKNIAQNIRGGNWGKGPFPVSGGNPASIIVVCDTSPLKPTQKMRLNHTGLTNARVLKTKYNIREFVNTLRKVDAFCNCVHSSDNATQALDYINIVCPDSTDFITQRSKELFDRFKTPYPVIKPLGGYSKRAKVEKIKYHGGEAVCKTFKDGRNRFMEREVLAREVGKNLKEMSEILEIGNNYIIIEWYNDTLHKNRSRLTKWLRRLNPLWHYYLFMRVKKIKSHFRKKGYEYIDLAPRNFLLDKDRGLKVYDFEFLQKSDSLEDVDISKEDKFYISSSVYGDLPFDFQKRIFKWEKKTGLPLEYIFITYFSFSLYIQRLIFFSKIYSKRLLFRIKSK